MSYDPPDNLVDLAIFRRSRRKSWRGWIEVVAGDQSPVARLVDFTGDDGLDTQERLKAWAAALRDLAAELDQTAEAIS